MNIYNVNEIPTTEEIINNIYLESYEEKGIDTSAVRNGILTLEQFENNIKNQEMKETFLFSSIVIIILLLIVIIFKQK